MFWLRKINFYNALAHFFVNWNIFIHPFPSLNSIIINSNGAEHLF